MDILHDSHVRKRNIVKYSGSIISDIVSFPMRHVSYSPSSISQFTLQAYVDNDICCRQYLAAKADDTCTRNQRQS